MNMTNLYVSRSFRLSWPLASTAFHLFRVVVRLRTVVLLSNGFDVFFNSIQFLANYLLDSKKKTDEENDYQPEILEELINDLSNLPNSVPLMSSKEK